MKYHSDMIRPEAVAFACGKLADTGTQQPDCAGGWRQHARQQAEECALTRAARAMKKKVFPPWQTHIRKNERRLVAAPAKAEAFYFKRRGCTLRAICAGF
ncbi:hypothetical protein GCM10011533_01970 [Streptosporangium jomthongense]|nr:hypothetical protein GCM10011533_01970 [Streptosporangium jomthongense]